MDFFGAIDVSASGLSAQRERMNVASSNLANAHTTRGADGGPYQRRDVVLESTEAGGVKVASIEKDQTPPRLEYDPTHPDANADGYVAYPNINPIEEMVDMITATRAYEAGVSAIGTATSMAERALTIGR